MLIAVGGKPEMPDIPGIELAINSDGFFELESLPKKCAVVGSGYIAVELAGVLQALWGTLRPGGVLFSSNPRGPDVEGWNGDRYGTYLSLETYRRYLR